MRHDGVSARAPQTCRGPARPGRDDAHSRPRRWDKGLEENNIYITNHGSGVLNRPGFHPPLGGFRRVGRCGVKRSARLLLRRVVDDLGGAADGGC